MSKFGAIRVQGDGEGWYEVPEDGRLRVLEKPRSAVARSTM